MGRLRDLLGTIMPHAVTKEEHKLLNFYFQFFGLHPCAQQLHTQRRKSYHSSTSRHFATFPYRRRRSWAARLAQEEEGYRCIVPFNVRSKPRAECVGVLFGADVNARDVKVRRESQKSETAIRGTPGGLALPDKGRGLGDRSALIQLPSFEGADAQLATVLRDNGTSALA